MILGQDDLNKPSCTKILIDTSKTNDTGKNEFIGLFLLHMSVVGELESRDKEGEKMNL